MLQEKTVEANEGLFDLKLSLSAGESARARIEFGGVVVYAADELSGSGKASVTGLYEGTFTISINKEAWIRAEYEKQVARINAEETDPQARENKIRNADGWSRSFVEAAATNLMGVYNQSQGNRARFEIQKTAGNESYYYTSGLPYIVNSLGHTSFLPATLTPLKNGENAGTSLKANSNGFTVVTEYNEKVYRLQATFKGNTLSGNWTTSLGNEVIYTASFSARKIREMD
ncbi:MAG: hypothetical protein IPH18_12180 [Chitinophagaceae bacterium]|nr:hypothetical protein [Chitinophagaceae bacterium]